MLVTIIIVKARAAWKLSGQAWAVKWTGSLHELEFIIQGTWMWFLSWKAL